MLVNPWNGVHYPHKVLGMFSNMILGDDDPHHDCAFPRPLVGAVLFMLDVGWEEAAVAEPKRVVNEVEGAE